MWLGWRSIQLPCGHQEWDSGAVFTWMLHLSSSCSPSERSLAVQDRAMGWVCCVAHPLWSCMFCVCSLGSVPCCAWGVVLGSCGGCSSWRPAGTSSSSDLGFFVNTPAWSGVELPCAFVSQRSAASPRSQQWKAWLECLSLAQVLPANCSQRCPGHSQPQALGAAALWVLQSCSWALPVAWCPLCFGRAPAALLSPPCARSVLDTDVWEGDF